METKMKLLCALLVLFTICTQACDINNLTINLKSIVSKYFRDTGNFIYLTYLLKNNTNQKEWNQMKNLLSLEISKEMPILITDNINTNKMVRSKNHVAKSAGYIVIAETYKEAATFFKGINNITHILWKPRSRFVLVILSEIDSIAITHIIKEFKEINVINFIVVCCETSALSIYSWKPYSEENKCGNITKIDHISLKNNTILSDKIDLYVGKIPKKFNNCSIRFVLFHYPPYVDIKTGYRPIFKGSSGLSVSILKIFSETKNLSIDFVKTECDQRWGTLLHNGSWTGMLNKLKNNEGDIGITGSQTSDRCIAFECSHTFFTISIRFYTPLPKKLPYWRNMIDIFSLSIWIIIFLSYIFISILYYFSIILSKDANCKLIDCFFTMYRIFICGFSNFTPISISIKLMMISSLIYFYHINLVYSSSLLAFITSPNYEKAIDDVADLHASGLRIFGTKELYSLAKKINNTNVDAVMSKFNMFNDSTLDLLKFQSNQNMAIIDSDEHVKYILKENLSNVHAFTSTILQFESAMFLRKGSPYLEALNDVQSGVHENGMMSKWSKDLQIRTPKLHKSGICQALTMKELQGSFWILFIGIFLSSVAFLLELLISAHKQKRQSLQTLLYPNVFKSHKINIKFVP